MRLGAIGAVLLVTALVLGRAENITITAHEGIKTYLVKNGLAELAAPVVAADAVIAGTGCVDLKHYLAWEIKFQGEKLYLLEGDFTVDRHSFLSSWKMPLVFGCP